MTATKNTMKNHLVAGLDITGQVIWINHLGQQVPATVTKGEKFTTVRDLEGNVLQSGGHGAKFTFVY
jgi:hypothetical protein